MKKVLVLNGSPRKTGNTSHLIASFINGASGQTDEIEQYKIDELNIKPCTGCLRCNLLKKCSIRDDDWEMISAKILASDVLVFGSPVYFHHVTAPLKMLLDRFRSFVHVQITEKGLIHTPHTEWTKDIVLLLAMGSSDENDSQPVIDLFSFLKKILGENIKLHIISGTRLAVSNHIVKTEEELKSLYGKLGLPEHLAAIDAKRNETLLKSCNELGRELTN